MPECTAGRPARLTSPRCIENPDTGMIPRVGGDNVVRNFVGCPLGSDENSQHKSQK